nr:TraL conjugative transposon family protein [uncultured Draconibacterium sp.]
MGEIAMEKQKTNIKQRIENSLKERCGRLNQTQQKALVIALLLTFAFLSILSIWQSCHSSMCIQQTDYGQIDPPDLSNDTTSLKNKDYGYKY